MAAPNLSQGQEPIDLCFSHASEFKVITSNFDILIPFSTTSIAIFEPNEISIPVNTMVQWINLNNVTYNIEIVKENNQTQRIDFDLKDLGGSYAHNFSNPGVYSYHNTDNKSHQGKITVGDAIQKGKFTTMTMGINLPLKTTELKRITFTVEPNFESTGIRVPKDSPLIYNFTIINPVGTPIYNKEIVDVDGRLYIELIPLPSTMYIAPSESNSGDTVVPGVISEMEEAGTQEDFVTWGFLDNMSNAKKICLNDVLHIMGPVLVDFIQNGIKIEKPYSLSVSILQQGNDSLINKDYDDTFILPNKWASLN